MTQSSPGGTLTVHSRLTSFAVFAAILASLFTFPAPTLANHVNASDFFIFSKAVFGKALDAEGGIQCDGAQDLTASVSGSNNEIFGRIHSNTDWNGGGQNNLFYAPVTYGLHDTDCTSLAGDNDYSPPPPNNGSPEDVNVAPAGVGTGGWPGNLGDRLNPDFLTFGNDITQILGVGATCAAGTSLTNAGDITLNPVTDNNKVICNGTGKVTLAVQDATMKITIISHGLIEISGQNAHIQPADAGHGILAWTDQSSFTEEFSIKVAGSDFSIGPSILFSPRSGQDISGSEGDELCIQHIGQGQIKVQGSTSDFGPGACGPPPQNPDVSVAKSPDGCTVNAGGTATFTILVTNLGPGASNVTLSDTLPNTVGGLTWSESADPSNACSVVGFSLTCDFGSVSDAALVNTRTVSVSTSVDTGDCGLMTNTVTITASGDINLVNNTDTGSITVTCPTITVDKTPDAGIVDAPDTATFSILTTNTGNGAADGSTLFDDLPEVAGDWAIVANPGGETAWAVCAISSALHPTLGNIGQWLSCGPETIAASPGPGHTRTVTVSAPVTTDDCGPLPNRADVATTNNGTDFDLGQITVQCPALSIDKTADDPTVDAGDDIGFSIVVSNSDAVGTGVAEGVTLDDPLPGSTALGVDWSIDAVLFNGVGVTIADFCAITGSPPAETLDCDFGDLNPGDDYEVQLSSGTSAPDGCQNATLPNTATADADNHAEITADASITVQCPDLDVVKTADNEIVDAGEEIGFVIEVVNSDAAGTGTATGVTIEDLLPDGDDIDWSVIEVWLNGVVVGAPGDFCSITGSPPAETLTCDFGDLEPGDSAAVHVTSGTTENSCATYDNTAVADALNGGEVESLEATVTVECPDLNLAKTADADPIDAGEEASFTITVWNAGPGDALDVELHDDLPAGLAWQFEIVSGDAVESDCGLASSQVPGEDEQMSIDCDFGTLAPTSMANGIVIRVFATTDRTDCGLLENTAEADASNLGEPLTASDSILVRCPTIELEKENDAVGPVLPGTEVTYTLTLTVDDGPAEDVVVVDVLPVGLANPTDISDGGVYAPATRTITWELGDLADGEYELTYQAVVAAGVANGAQLVNEAAATSPNSQCPDLETLGPECEDESTVIVRVPTLVIDKVANAEVITISGPASAPVATPSVVTWTLSYTLTNGPVTNAVITDVVPAGFTFLDAANGGTLVGGTTVTWNLGTLTTSGSVSFRTTVNVATISRVAPTVNVAVIDSDQTPPDQGQDSVTVVVVPPPLGGNPPVVPNTAMGIGIDGQPVTVPIELLVALFLGTLGALAFANVRSSRRRSN